MRTSLTLLLWLLGSLLGAGPARAHGGEDHGAGARATTAADASYFSVFTVSPQFEALLRYEPVQPGEPAHLRLFLADFATNAPVRGAKLALTVPEDNKAQLKATEQGPGEYLVETTFPAKRAYSLTVQITAGDRADLLLLENIDVGKALPQAEAPVAAAPWLTWKTALLLLGVFLAGVGVAALLLRRRPVSTTTATVPAHENAV